MIVLQDRDERNQLRKTIIKAEDRQIISREEAGFVITLVERFRTDIEKKIKQMDVLRGELSQLQANEKIIVDLIDNMIKAAERDIARQETMDRIKSAKSATDDDSELDESDDVITQEME